MSEDNSDQRAGMQEVMGKMRAEQQAALLKPCPQCWGTLEIQDICRVQCPACNLVFDVQDINQGKLILPHKC
jgi:hypothetical protein